MIRQFKSNDMPAVLDIWLSASVKAHGFIEAAFWQSQVKSMRDTYLPAAEVYVYEKESTVVGFYALYGDKLAAIFVTPAKQGEGIGKHLLEHAKTQRKSMTLTVYKSNTASVGFYLSQGFSIIDEGIDEHTGHAEYAMKTGSPESN